MICEGVFFMLVMDCLGDQCPVPLMKLQQCRELKAGESVKLITDHSCVCESITDYCKKLGLHLEVVEPMNGIWEMTICRD